MKRSFRDHDLPSLAPPLFRAASEVTKLDPPRVEPRRAHASKRSKFEILDSALLNAYMLQDSEPRKLGPHLGLGMGLEIVPPQWKGSWAGHGEHMSFLGHAIQTPFRATNAGRQEEGGGAAAAAARQDSTASPPPPPCSDDQEARPLSGTALSERTDDGGGAESAPTAAVPSSSSRRPVVAHRSGEDTSETDMEASDDASQKRAAKSFAARTQLRRGFFCSALKRQLEALRAENAALKDCARAELDQAECAALFATLGSESAQIIGDKTAAEATTEAAPLPTTTESSSALLLRRDLSMVQVVQNAQKAFVISQPGRPDNPIMWCSDAFLTLTGYSRSAVLGRNCRFLQGPETNPKAVDDIRAAIEAEAEADVTLLNYRADGSKFWNRFFIAPLRDSTGKVIYFVGVQSDATHLVQSRQLQPSHEPRALALT